MYAEHIDFWANLSLPWVFGYLPNAQPIIKDPLYGLCTLRSSYTESF